MARSTISAWLFRAIALTALLVATAADSSASVIYEFREAGSSSVIGTVEIESPPATNVDGWNAAEPDVIALFLDDGVFGLGSGNVLLAAIAWHGTISSFAGLELDSGQLDIDFPSIPSPVPGGRPIRPALVIPFNAAPGADLILHGTHEGEGDDVGIDIDLQVSGDWTPATVPEPGTVILLGLGLMAAVRSARRRAQ